MNATFEDPGLTGRPPLQLVQSIAAFVREVVQHCRADAGAELPPARLRALLDACCAAGTLAEPAAGEREITALLHRLLYKEARRLWVEAETLVQGGAAEAGLACRRASVRVSGVADRLRGPLPVSRPAQAALASAPMSVAGRVTDPGARREQAAAD